MDSRLQDEKQKLIEIGIALTSEIDLTRLLEKIIFELRHLTNADGGSVYLRDENILRFEVAQNDTLTLRHGNADVDFKPFPLPLDEQSIAGYVALTGTVLNIPDVYQLSVDFPFFFDPTFDVRNQYLTHSMLVVPIKDHSQEVIGVLQLINALDKEGKVIPFDPQSEDIVLALASQAAVAINNVRLIQTIQNLFEAMMMYSVSAIDARSPHTAGHSRRVAAYSLALARTVNDCQEGSLSKISFDPKQLEALRFSAWLHDIGKIGVRDYVLDKNTKLAPGTMTAIQWRFYLAQVQAASTSERKSLEEDYDFLVELNRLNYLPENAPPRLSRLAGQTVVLPNGQDHPLLTPEELYNLMIPRGNLTPEEYTEIQNHIYHTIKILEHIPFSKHLQQVPKIAAAHHERMDGNGYPFHLKAKKIPLESRILALVDIFDSLTAADRPYRSACAVPEALEILEAEAQNGGLDKDLVDLFISRQVYQGVMENEIRLGDNKLLTFTP
jgi:HD-GYP domain-containing protein (c-di-GMP phosphodiesterase class II)